MVLAKEAVTLDLISDGRFELGLGAGWVKREYDQAGLAFDPPRTRVGRLNEAIHLLRRLWSGETVVFAGQAYRLDGVVLSPRPTRPLHLSIGGGVGWVRAAAGERFAQIELAALIQNVVVTDDRERGAAILATERGLTPSQVLASPYFLLGSIDAITAQVEASRALCGISYLSAFPRDVETFAPVVARLAGR